MPFQVLSALPIQHSQSAHSAAIQSTVTLLGISHSAGLCWYKGRGRGAGVGTPSGGPGRAYRPHTRGPFPAGGVSAAVRCGRRGDERGGRIGIWEQPRVGRSGRRRRGLAPLAAASSHVSACSVRFAPRHAFRSLRRSQKTPMLLQASGALSTLGASLAATTLAERPLCSGGAAALQWQGSAAAGRRPWRRRAGVDTSRRRLHLLLVLAGASQSARYHSCSWWLRMTRSERGYDWHTARGRGKRDA